jgi:hypothetical protein
MYTNLATKLFLNGKDSHAENSPLEDGMIFVKYAWEVKITGDGESGLASAPPMVAKTCDLPKWQIDTQLVNVYNHKTIVQTKMTYDPLTMTFYDQAGGEAEALIMNFIKAQFDSTDASKAPTQSPLTIEIKMKNLSGPGATDKVYTLNNAYITDVQHDTLDYSASDAVMWTITVRYEDLVTAGFDTPPPKVGTGIASKPKPPKPKPPVTVTPVVKPPPADAVNNEIPYGNPMGDNIGGGYDGQGLGIGDAIMSNRNNAPVKSTPAKEWPTPAVTGNSTYPANASAPVAARPTEGWKAQQVWDSKYASGWNADGSSKIGTAATPSTGAPTANTPKTLPDSYTNSPSGFNPEWQKARDDYLKAHPPLTNSPQSKLAAEHVADAAALRVAPRYAAQTRTVQSDGTIVDRANLSPGGMNSTTTSQGQSIANTQAQREQLAQQQKAGRGKDY